MNVSSSMHSKKIVSPKNGKSQSTPMHTGAGQQPVAGLQSSWDVADVCTVQFAVAPPPLAAPSFGIFNCEAIVSWAIDGNLITRRVSIGNGTSISGTAQGVTVQLQDVTNAAFLSAPNKYEVLTTLSGGSRASFNQPPTLIGFEDGSHTVLASGNIFLQIPQDAGAISAEISVGQVVVSTFDVGKINIIYSNNAGVILKQYDPAIETGFVPIPPSATQIQVINFDAVNNFRIQVTFGIDG